MRILILFPKLYWETKMSFGRRDVIRCLLDRTQSVLSGQGWDGWRDDRTLRENVASLMPGARAILWYKPQGSEKEGVASIREPQDRSIPAVAIYNEAWWPDRAAFVECEQSGTNLAIHHHENDAHQFDGMPAIHLPHCVDAKLFRAAAKPWADRTTEVLVTGVLADTIYPLRCRVAKLIKAGKLTGKVLPHPGYRLPNVRICDIQRRQYARELGNAKVVFCCSSIHRYYLAKYNEAAAAGAIVAGDAPHDSTFHSLFGVDYVNVNNDMADGELCSKLSKAVNGTERVISGDLQRIVCRERDVGRYCDALVKLIGGAVERFVAQGFVV